MAGSSPRLRRGSANRDRSLSANRDRSLSSDQRQIGKAQDDAKTTPTKVYNDETCQTASFLSGRRKQEEEEVAVTSGSTSLQGHCDIDINVLRISEGGCEIDLIALKISEGRCEIDLSVRMLSEGRCEIYLNVDIICESEGGRAIDLKVI